ncbi:MAG: DMT family transporter [Pseudomonadota bacterium]
MASLWNKKGAFFIVLSSLLVSVTSALVHGLKTPISAGQLLFLKAGIGFLFCIPWLIRHWPSVVHTPNKRWHAKKAIIGATGNVFLIMALQKLPLADVTTLSLTSAILTTLGAALFFKETLRPSTVAALLLGGVGVCVVLKPSMMVFSWGSLLPLLSAVCYTASSLFVKKVSLIDSTEVSLTYLLGGMMLLSAPFACFSWVSMSARDCSVIAVIACLYCIVQWLLIYSYAHASAAFLAPFKFARFPFACIFGLVYFGESPSWYVVSGGVLIFASCSVIQYTRHDPSYLLRMRGNRKTG